MYGETDARRPAQRGALAGERRGFESALAVRGPQVRFSQRTLMGHPALGEIALLNLSRIQTEKL